MRRNYNAAKKKDRPADAIARETLIEQLILAGKTRREVAEHLKLHLGSVKTVCEYLAAEGRI